MKHTNLTLIDFLLWGKWNRELQPIHEAWIALELQSALKNIIELNGKYQKALHIRINIIFWNFGFICMYLDVNKFLTLGRHQKFWNLGTLASGGEIREGGTWITASRDPKLIGGGEPKRKPRPKYSLASYKHTSSENRASSSPRLENQIIVTEKTQMLVLWVIFVRLLFPSVLRAQYLFPFRSTLAGPV